MIDMTIQEIQTREEDQTFDCKSIQIEPKALAVPIVACQNINRVTEKLPENIEKLTEKLPENIKKLPENLGIIDRIIKKANSNGDKLKENKVAILRLIIDDPYISKTDIANILGISYTAVGSNIKAMRGKYLRRVGPDKGGFWEIIE